MLDRLDEDHAAVQAKSILNTTLDYFARMVLILEPSAGAAETWVATFVGGLVAGAAFGLPFAGLASALTLLTEKGIDAELKSWALARVGSQ